MTATSTLITDYIAEGTHAARPTTPNVPAGASSLYYETDTSNTFAWSGSAWVQVNGGAGVSIVQNGSGSGSIQGVTLGSAPISGNLLIAFCNNNTSGVVGAGWTIIATNNSIEFATIAYKIAGAGESATQNPMNAVGGATCTIYELHLGGISLPVLSLITSTAGSTLNVIATKSGGILIGAIVNDSNSALPTAITGATLDSNSALAKSTQGFHLTPSQGTNGIAFTYATTHNVYAMGICVF